MEQEKRLNILFLTLGRVEHLETHGIYSDLLRCLRDRGHCVCTVSPREKRTGLPTRYVEEEGVRKLFVRTGNLTGQVNLIEKGLATLDVDRRFIRGIKHYFRDIRFDLVLYTTPPITFVGTVEAMKRRDGARTYLLLKDIFPQNAVDIGMMRTTGPMEIMYRFFRRKEKRLYAVSDRIGCMSPANAAYLCRENPEIDDKKVEVCPNSLEPADSSLTPERKQALRVKYGIPMDRTVFLYGGNLGKPQGIPFLIDCLRAQKNPGIFFVIVGGGSEFPVLERFVREEQPANVLLLQKLQKEDYEALAGAADVGLIFLDHRFTIPNFPSRLLSYLEAKLPVLAVTDPNTDVGAIAVKEGFGWFCESNDPTVFVRQTDEICKTDLKAAGERGHEWLLANCDVRDACDRILAACR